MIGWVIFRADNFAVAANYLYTMSGLEYATETQPLMRYATDQVLCAILSGVICSTPVWGRLRAQLASATADRPVPLAIGHALETLGVLVLFFLSVVWLAGETYNPFIYFRF
jgi:alginate O-acetyltransferase complex protein AlgI